MKRRYAHLYRCAACALIGLAAFWTPALAADPGAPTSIVIHSMNGTTTTMPIDAKMANQLLADPNVKPLKAGIIVFVANGKPYMIEDHKMPNGKMLISSWASLYPTYDAAEGGG